MYRPQRSEDSETFMCCSQRSEDTEEFMMIKKIIEFFEKHKRISFIFILFILAAMWYFSSLPGNSTSIPRFSWTPIVYHFAIFSSFAFFFLAIITKKEIKIREFSITILISLIVAILDEFHQYFVPFRSVTIEDILIDMTGVISVTLICLLIKNYALNLKSDYKLKKII